MGASLDFERTYFVLDNSLPSEETSTNQIVCGLTVISIGNCREFDPLVPTHIRSSILCCGAS